MFLHKAALRPVPGYAIVDAQAIESLERTLEQRRSGGLQKALDEGYRDLDRKHPELATWLAAQVSGRRDELAQSLGYFLVVAVYLAFLEAFPRGLFAVDEHALHIALATLEADEELRASDPGEVLETDDVIAMGQPALVEFVQTHLNEALEQASEGTNLEDLDDVYRAVLVEIVAFSHAVRTPAGHVGPKTALA